MENYQKRLRQYRWAVLLLAVLNLVLLLFFVNRPPRPGKEDIVALWQQELQLDAAQTTAFRSAFLAHRHLQDSLHGRMRDNRQALIAAMAQAEPDTAAARLKARESDAIHHALGENLIQHYQELYAICKPEQQARFNAAFQKLLQRRPPGAPDGPPGRN
ncbi:MAG: periplasmic heavy metal sensor [Chitinophagales bacterium]|nr:periplasmic heavy metal sensor [Chitinophagales bacterium]